MPLIAIDKLVIPDSTTVIPLLRWDPALRNRLCRRIDHAGGAWPKSFGKVAIDQDNLVIGGVHRTNAAAKRGITKVPCEVRHFADAAERLEFAAQDNAEHGEPWTPKQEALIQIIMEQHGMSQQRIAAAFRVPLAVVQRKPIVNVVRRSTDGSETVVGRTYVPRPTRKALKNRGEVSEEEAAVLDSFLTPHPVGIHLAEIVRISEANALPTLNLDLYALTREAMARLDAWIQRDEHLLDGEEVA